jgi:serralysin
LKFTSAFAVVLLAASYQPAARAAFHLFYIQEAYSNASGSVQFIELFTNFDSQQFVNSFGVSLTSNGHTFSFPTDTPAPTGGHAVLLATAGFGSLPGGATPDYTIPSNFFNPAGDTLDFASGVDTKTFAAMPTDGIKSLNYTGQFTSSTIATNSPRDYAGTGGSVNLSTPEPGVLALALIGLLSMPFRRRRL